MNIIVNVKITGNNTEKTETFKLIHKTVLASKEKREKEIKNGQKEVWTAKKGVEKRILIKEY